MKKPRRAGSRSGERAVGGEWVGGWIVAPFHVTEGEPYRPEIIPWVEMPDQDIVNGTVIDPKGPDVSFSGALLQAMKAPMVGPPRRPARIRVADRRLAEEIRDAAQGIEIVVAPTPEMDHVLQHMVETFAAERDEHASYFEGGRISRETVEEFFRAAEGLFLLAPWKKAADGQILRLDIPRLGVEGACLSIIGALGQSVGFLIFPSLSDFDRFLEAAERLGASEGMGAGEEPVDLGTPILSLTFERGADLPAGIRREVAKHGWPVAGPNAYPRVQKRDRDGMAAPLSERDVQVVSACAASLNAFFIKHAGLFDLEDFEPVCESYFDQSDLEVRFTLPCEAGPLFEVNDPGGAVSAPARAKTRVARNAPCPCGSGKKYNRCCLTKDESERMGSEDPAMAVPESRGARLHRMDERVVDEMMRFAARRFGSALLQAEEDFFDPGKALELLIPWTLYHFPIEGKPVFEWFLEEEAGRLSGDSRAWLEAQRASWLSIWEVTGVDPGRGRLSLKDLLSGQERTVEEVDATETLVRRDVVLGRVVDDGGISVLCGLFPSILPPMEAAEVVRQVRGRLRRKRAVPVERLRDAKIGRYMIGVWEDAVEELRVRRSVPPILQNTDGEDMLFTIDHFSFEPAVRREVEERLASMEGVQPPASDGSDKLYMFAHSGKPKQGGMEHTIIGTVRVSEGKLRQETNSVPRADRLRARIGEACGGLVRHRTREHADPRVFLKDGAAPRRPRDEPHGPIPPSEAGRLVREFKESHYAGWVDLPIPALGGETPREAVRTKEGKRQVDLLLKELENSESRLPEEERFDFTGLRKRLGLDA